jgi:predicted permease
VLFSTISIIAPLVFLGGVGYLLRLVNFISDDIMDALGTFTFRIALPCMLFRLTSTISFPSQFPFSLILAYYIPVALVYALNTIVFTKFFSRNYNTSIIASINACFGNTIALGIPIALITLGEQNVLPYLIAATLHTPLIIFPSLIFLSLHKPQQKISSLFINLFHTLSRNPNMIAIASGFLFNALPFSVPTPIDSALFFLQQAALPCALITIGGSLVRYGIRGHISQALTTSAVKVIILPLLVFLFAAFLFKLSFFEQQALIILATLPTGITPFLIAGNYNTGIRISTSTLFLTACLAAPSMTLFLYLTAYNAPSP